MGEGKRLVIGWKGRIVGGCGRIVSERGGGGLVSERGGEG